ncbi:MAG: B12-binding domain-containing radical SAM protein [Deltaproteobacteria bacterium]|nr:B12-binding domain-containing radical SAM protein [Deltaproteobacteria bacterium]MBW2503813.1 B12-binding domain-containing radical SAM protein [Deltaproteobacteria bacterium]
MRTVLTTLHSKFIHSSLSLPCLAAFCKEGCGEIRIREFTIHEPRESILRMLMDEDPDVVAFSVYIWNRRQTFDLIDALSVAMPGLRIIIGGPETSCAGEELFRQHPGITALIHGEGELPLRDLLRAWNQRKEPGPIPRLTRKAGAAIISGPDGPVLDPLDSLPSALLLNLVCLDHGFVYYETSRGCPFKCSFCLSAKDSQVRYYSMERVESDLLFLMQKEVAKIKLVDRTFNIHPERTRKIFQYILKHNRSSHFHFEIAAHLLDEATLSLLEQVPPDMFQFEIGIQSTLGNTLSAVDRDTDLKLAEQNILRLRKNTKVHLHLDLVSGLPGERYSDILNSIDRVLFLCPQHLQIEPLKVLPGTPLYDQAEELSLHYDPNPPYTILKTNTIDFSQLSRLNEISRLVDLLYNSHKFSTFLQILSESFGSCSAALEDLAAFWHKQGWFRFPTARQIIYDYCWTYIKLKFPDKPCRLKEALAYDYAGAERITTNRVPEFLQTELTTSEQAWIRQQVKAKTETVKGKGIKLQYFAAQFSNLPDVSSRTIILFFYLTQPGEKMKTEEQRLPDRPIDSANS